jgi:alkylation response protein AidB-like acyl-CoA dehydrogenase
MFELTRSQKEIQKAARDFAKGEFDKDQAIAFEKENRFPAKIWKTAAELGFIGIHFPEDLSGGGLGLVENCLLAEAFCRKDSTTGLALTLGASGAECLASFGSAQLKKKYIPRVAEGEILSAGAFSDAGAGPAVPVTQTRAVEDGAGFILNGEKSYVLNAAATGFYVVLARTETDAKPEKSLSLFLVDAASSGITVENLGKTLGVGMNSLSTVRFTNVDLPGTNLIGQRGQGLALYEKYLNVKRITASAQALGIALGALDRALAYVKQREQFGRKIAKFEVTRHKLADMAMKTELARLITYQAAAAYDVGSQDSALPAMARVTTARTAFEVADEAIQLFGGYGYMTEQEVERFYRDAKALEIGGSGGFHRKNVIAASVIGRLK